jgi:hypothetical protein
VAVNGALGRGDEDVAAPFDGGEAMSSSPWEEALGEGDVDVATPALERGGDVLIAVGKGT